ncbi:MAG: glutamate formimidoyltransferase [Planctomycetes bacterium]|nr:glutamate formimidoyltransferase [Planctomycetota bacterium]
MPLFECVPNFSEGRDAQVVDALVTAIVTTPGVRLLDREMDSDHHRSVLTFVGEPGEVSEAAFRAASEATRRIDLTRHRGEHPRMGATDVIPFVPLRGATLPEGVELARRLGRRIGEELGVPVYLYAAAAARPERVRLPDVRKGEFEGLREAIGNDPSRAPDFGPDHIHPTAGAIAVGARMPLIAYNINLESNDLALAKRIAREIRESSGGLPGVQSKGFELAAKGIVQVSMNLTDFKTTGMRKVYETVSRLADGAGVAVRESELIGLVPAEALGPTDPADLRIANFSPDQIIERRLEKAESR